MHHTTFQEDGDKKIELKPGFMMEHDEDVKIVFLWNASIYLELIYVK